MKKSKFTESQIIKILGEQSQGKPVADICREHGISQLRFINGKASILVLM
jgi:putative transposase